MERNLDNLNQQQAKANGWKILKPLNCEVVGKATYEVNTEEGHIQIMKSTKRFPVYAEDNLTLLGWIYNTSTEYHKDNNVSIAEALVFVSVK